MCQRVLQDDMRTCRGVKSQVRYHEVPGVYKAAVTILDSGGAV
jgi:hypothetical protein